MPRLALVLVCLSVVVGHSGCNHHVFNPESCDLSDNVGKGMCPDASTIGGSCSNDSQCTGMASFPVCDTMKGHCVECFGDEAPLCGGKAPICTNDQCAPCTQHGECKTSNVCLSDGSCAAVTDVAYVDPMGTDNPNCTKTTPCTKVTSALDTNRPYVKLRGTTDEGATININNQKVTLLADPGAALTQAQSGTILQITGTSTVEIDDLQINGAKGAGNPAISVPAGNKVTLSLERVTISGSEGVGISCQGGSLTVSRSTISSNQGGGISTGGMPVTFDITNTFIYRNGDPANSTVGGASLTPLISIGSTNRFEFNTVVDNQSKDGATLTGGILCDQTGFLAPNNIIARNSVNNNLTKPNSNTLGLCMYPTSVVDSTVAALKFRSPDNNNPYDYHIQSGSSAIGKATTSSSISIDFDNQPRPQNASDQGADQYKP